MTVISFQIISGGVVQTRVGGLIRKRVPQMRAAQHVDGHILDSICSYDRHQGFWGIALFTISAGLYVMKYVWFIISAVQSIYEVGSGKFGEELTSISLSLPSMPARPRGRPQEEVGEPPDVWGVPPPGLKPKEA